jgi:hypothetical protein
VGGDIPLRVELDLQRPTPYGRHLPRQAQPERGQPAGQVVAVLADPAQRAQQHVGRLVVRTAVGDRVDGRPDPDISLREQQLRRCCVAGSRGPRKA